MKIFGAGMGADSVNVNGKTYPVVNGIIEILDDKEAQEFLAAHAHMPGMTVIDDKITDPKRPEKDALRGLRPDPRPEKFPTMTAETLTTKTETEKKKDK